MGDLLVEDGLIAAVGVVRAVDASGEPGTHGGPAGSAVPSIVIDCAGLVLMPAFVDLHAHFRDPGFLDKERLESGCLAAAAGGYGTVVAMANTKPVTDRVELALSTRSRALELGLVDYYPALTMTRGLAGLDHGHLDGLEEVFAGPGGTAAREGIRLLSDDGRDVADEAVLRSVFARAAALGLVASCHCELGPVASGSGAHGPGDLAASYPQAQAPAATLDDAQAIFSSERGLAADREAEIAGVGRALRLARETGCAIHLAHLSTRPSIELVRREKARLAKARAEGTNALGLFRLTCEVTPHHLGLTRQAALALGAAGAGRVNPWLRDEDDRLALVEGLADGTIDAIATDHAPHTAPEKTAGKAGGAPGFSGLETAFALCNTVLERGEAVAGPGRHAAGGVAGQSVPGGWPGMPSGLSRLSGLMSAAPARVLGLTDRGLIEVGRRADLVLVDPEAEVRVDPGRFKSRGKNTPLAGAVLRGRVLMTFHQGRIVHDAR
jgi:dihydroorotase